MTENFPALVRNELTVQPLNCRTGKGSICTVPVSARETESLLGIASQATRRRLQSWAKTHNDQVDDNPWKSEASVVSNKIDGETCD